MELDFEIIDRSAIASKTDDAIVVTNFDDYDEACLRAALSKESVILGSVPKDTESSDSALTLQDIDDLAMGINSDITKVLRSNAIVRTKIHTNALMGRTYEAIYSNVNSNYTLSYPILSGGRNKNKELKRAQDCIDEFNRQIHLERFIRDCVAGVVLEGNRILHLRIEDGTYAIHKYPLPVAFVTDFEENGIPLLAIDIKELTNRLRKQYQTNKKKKALWVKDIADEIKRSYPSAFADYQNGESYSKLDRKYTRILRINNLDRKYGVSMFFKALKDDAMLNQLATTDMAIAQSKQRKILFQTLRPDLLEKGKKKAFADALYAHSQLMQSLATTSSVYTSSIADDLKYVSPPSDDSKTDKTMGYRISLMNALGIEFINTDSGTVSVANISVKQLMRVINSITEQVEEMLEQFYRVALEANGINVEYAPSITIIDSEQLEADVALSLAQFVYSTLNGSARTAFEIVGVDYDNEVLRRKSENDEKSDEIFFPRGTSYTTSNNGRAGRPASNEDTEKQLNDQARNDE